MFYHNDYANRMSPISFRKIIVCLYVFCAATGARAQNNLPEQSLELARHFVITDTVFKDPYIDVDEWRDKPVRHRYVHGGFKGTQTRFSFYFPPKEAYEGRFFQYITPFPDNEYLSQGASGEEDKIGFSISSGGYFVETNGGGKVDFAKPSFSNDPTIVAYRANAASAQYSRTVAIHLFGGNRPYGYAFGGSGGAYRTIGGIENTQKVWDGVVPYVVGSPMAIPNVFSVRMQAMRVLNDKLPAIIDAVEPGGNGNMYDGLNPEEKQALLEVTKMGFPPQSWFGYKTMGVHGFVAVYQGMVMADHGYFSDDFWKKSGYAGANPPASLVRARVQQESKIKTGINTEMAVNLGLMEAPSAQERGSADLAWKSQGKPEGTMPVAFQLEDVMPDVNFQGGDLLIKSGEVAGKTLQLTKIVGDKVLLGPADMAVLAKLKSGDLVQVDNSNFLAAQFYHRYQVPGKEYKVWDQFRDASGKPLYPQRPMLLGPLFTRSAAGMLPSGKFSGKMILLSSLWDREAFPWQADWYRARVTENLGDQTDQHFRLWYTDHALHGDLSKQEDPTRTVSYLGVLQQALRDLSTWVEKNIPPAPTTNYKVVDGQVIVPPKAQAREGIQPVVDLRAGIGKRVIVKVGQSVNFTANVEVPQHRGQIIAADWDFDGTGAYPEVGKITATDKTGAHALVKTSHKFSKAGTYFVTLRAISQRSGDAQTPFARIQNLDRVRVIVK